MTKQARTQLVNITLPIAIQRAVNNSNFRDKFRQFNEGCITRKELDTCLREASTVSARLGQNEQPLHCPRRTTTHNKPTRQRKLYN